MLQAAMGWTNSHLHCFVYGDRRFGMVGVEEDAPDLEDERRTHTSTLLRLKGDQLVYRYDYGDGWEHQVALESVVHSDVRLYYPLCVGGARACPPEDCGGCERLRGPRSSPRHAGRPRARQHGHLGRRLLRSGVVRPECGEPGPSAESLTGPFRTSLPLPCAGVRACFVPYGLKAKQGPGFISHFPPHPTSIQRKMSRGVSCLRVPESSCILPHMASRTRNLLTELALLGVAQPASLRAALRVSPSTFARLGRGRRRGGLQLWQDPVPQVRTDAQRRGPRPSRTRVPGQRYRHSFSGWDPPPALGITRCLGERPRIRAGV